MAGREGEDGAGRGRFVDRGLIWKLEVWTRKYVLFKVCLS